MAEEGEEEIIDEENSLKCIFARSFDDLIFRNKLGQLCASYLGGIWTTVPCQQIRITVEKGGANNKIFMVELPNGTKVQRNEPEKAILRIYDNLSEDYELPEAVIT
ncbi:unnamed protein product, partial [Onchocerca flexuosa]|uniref:Protein kinase domain-containing protein n=1 Tax=Onchocerca flexuosa TaxID=387005 RepID=A0A183HHR5_9BILA